MFLARGAGYGFFIFSILPLFFFTACIGGGGGGGGQVQYGGASSEFAAQSGLSYVAASAAIGAGYSGRNIRVGVVDSGVDGRHSEFSGRLHAGGDWQSASDGRIDLHGHGTHVAAILGGAQDGVGMHGVAPRSQIYAYRILNASGNFGGQSGENMIPGLVSDARRKNLHIINNSWGSRVEINDISRSEIEAELPRELAAWQSAVSSGMVMVWAAGNQRDNQVSVRAGLPYYFSSLRPGWLTVVSSGASGTEPVYTNRCGLAASWCLTAPGGGDDQARTGIWAADTGGGYVRRSGTSMSAPHISGGLALLLEAFPTLSPQSAAARLLQTASYDGLVTADGCTLSSCGSARMQSVFGRGQMDLQAALAPVLGLDIATAQSLFAVEASQLNAGPILYGPLKTAMAGVKITANDRFDGAQFLIDGTSFISTNSLSTQDMMTGNLVPKRPVSKQFGLHHYLARGSDGHISDRHPERLFDLQTGVKEAVYIMDKSSSVYSANQTGWTFRYGQQEQNHALSALWRREGKQSQIWLGQGVGDQKIGWFDSSGDGAFALNGARSFWQFAGIQKTLGRFQFQAEGLFGKSWLKSGSGLVRSGEVDVQSWLMQLHTEFGHHHRLTFSFGQPLNVRRGMVELYKGNGEGTGELHFENHRQEHQQRIGWDYQPLEGIDMSAYYLDVQNPSSARADSEYRYGAQLRFSF